MVPTCQQTNSISTSTRRVTGYLSAREDVSSDSHRGCPEHDGRPGCRQARFGSAAASSDRFKLSQDDIRTDKSFS